MRYFFFNLLTLSPQNLSPEGLVACGVVWLGVWGVLVGDIMGSGKPPLWKFSWVFIVTVPVVGGILYSLRCLLVADWAAAIFWRKQPPSSRRGKKAVI